MLRLDALKEVAHAWLNERPGTLILWLFLGPHDVCVLVAIKAGLDSSEREWRELLHSDDSDVLNVSLGAFSL